MSSPLSSSMLFHESGRELPVVAQAQVVVCGGGPAGVGAALGAAYAQQQAGVPVSVHLLETHGQLGGIWTTGLLCWILDAANKPGVMKQILDAIHRRRQAMGEPDSRSVTGKVYDPEQMKWLLDKLMIQAGVRVHLHTRVVAAPVTSGRITHVITESKSGRQAIAAHCVIDCTGDGDVAALAGCDYEYGRPADRQGDGQGGGQSELQAQPMSLLGVVGGVDRQAIASFYRRDGEPWADAKHRLQQAMQAGGYDPSYARPSLFEIYPDLFMLMSNHAYGYDPHDALSLTDATMRMREELNQAVDALRSQGGCWSGLRLVASAGQIGVRESRRPQGLARVTLDDMLAGQRHADAVCECRFGIDVHATARHRAQGAIEAAPRAQPYDIPYRALVSRDVSHLLFAGRCVSGDFLAHSSYRVTGNSVALGQAAGCAAAVSGMTGQAPAELDYVNQVAPVMASLDRDPPRVQGF